jgi:hypothetical protein
LTIYAQLLLVALSDAETYASPPISDLISRAVANRSMLASAPSHQDRVEAALAYDVALVRLCERLQIDHDLAGELAGPDARLRAECFLMARLPSLTGAFKSDETLREKE